MEMYIHIASFSPWSILPVVGHKLAEKMATGIGFAGFYLMPMRGVTKNSVITAKLPVVFHQEVWNATTFLDFFMKRKGSSGGKTKFWDPVMFPSPQVCSEMSSFVGLWTYAQRVVIRIEDFKPYNLIEVHAGLNLSLPELVLWAQRFSRPLMLDLKHLSAHMHTGKQLPFGDWQTALEVLLPFTTLVQVSAHQWDSKALEVLRYQIAYVKELGYTSKVQWMIEYDPRALGVKNLLNPWKLIDALLKIKTLAEEILATK